MIAIAGCAEGDNLFGDASNAGSGAYARSLATQQQQLDAERSRAAALGARSSELKQRGAALDAAIGQERHKLAVLRARVERLDRDIRSRQAATAHHDRLQPLRAHHGARAGTPRQTAVVGDRRVADSVLTGEADRRHPELAP